VETYCWLAPSGQRSGRCPGLSVQAVGSGLCGQRPGQWRERIRGGLIAGPPASPPALGVHDDALYKSTAFTFTFFTVKAIFNTPCNLFWRGLSGEEAGGVVRECHWCTLGLQASPNGTFRRLDKTDLNLHVCLQSADEIFQFIQERLATWLQFLSSLSVFRQCLETFLFILTNSFDTKTLAHVSICK